MKLQGYGIQKAASDWAKLLGMDHVDMLYYIEKKGLTVEDLFKIRGKKPPKTERKARFTEQMKKTQQRIGLLLEMSGYIDRNDLEDIEVERVGTHTDHAVKFRGKALGVYNYKTGALSLSSGEGIPLWKIEWEDAKIQQREDGCWVVHPETKSILLARVLRSNEKKAE